MKATISILARKLLTSVKRGAVAANSTFGKLTYAEWLPARDDSPIGT